MDELTMIMFRMGYLTNDPLKVAEIKQYIAEAERFMVTSGIPYELLSSPTAYTVKSVWADKRDKGVDDLIAKDSLIVHLVNHIKWTKSGY